MVITFIHLFCSFDVTAFGRCKALGNWASSSRRIGFLAWPPKKHKVLLLLN
jgi:hypothetical protein